MNGVAMSHSNAQGPTAKLRGFRILVVEDDRFLAADEGSWLEELGCTVLGPITKVPAALDVLRSEVPDGAVLDIDVSGTAIYPVARLLARRGVPFLFVSASDPETIDKDFRSVPRLTKPIGEYQLQRAALELFTRQ